MSFDPVQILNERFAAAIRAAFPDLRDADPQITGSRNPKFGDFQCNAAMALAKQLGRPPREVAQTILENVDLSGVAEPLTPQSIAGPGFINVTLKADALARLVQALDSPSLGAQDVKGRQTIVVDLCGVNLAKQMHVGHLRATIIGDTLARAFERLGYKVIRQNHVGDWGLPIAMVTGKLMQLEAAGRDIAKLDLDAIEKLYRDAQTECDADDKGLEIARKFNLGPKVTAELEAQVSGANEALAVAKQTLIKLQAHDPATFRVWQRIADVTMDACLATCKRLGTAITRADTAGESSYAEELAPMVESLLQRGIAEPDQGALVIRVQGFEEPCIIRKSDGGFLYATTDLAAIRRRVQKFGASRVIYAVDARQALHFKLVFGAAIRAGFATLPAAGHSTPALASLEHAPFGTVLGEDGRPFKTRSGENVKLSDLLDEAVERAGKVVAVKNPDLTPAERATIAEAVGIAAIKYADLSNDRVKDYVFSFDRMLAFEGNSGPYLLFALVRIKSIFRKAAEQGIPISEAIDSPLAIGAKEEKDIALALLRYPEVLRSVVDTLEPHRMCQYLYELAGAFSAFVTNCSVLQAPDAATRASRLRLCRVTERVLSDGLGVLGIPVLDRM